MNNTFANTLHQLRTSQHLTSAELASKANVPPSLISGLQTGHRVIGEHAARKVGQALHLTGNELEDFVYLAINGCSEKVLQRSKNYPAELLNLIATELLELGIVPDRIKKCVRKPQSNKAKAAIFLDDGREARINLEVAYS